MLCEFRAAKTKFAGIRCYALTNRANEGAAVDPALLQGFYLRDLLVDPVQGQVTGGAVQVHLPPKAMEVLLCLASSPGTLVTREALIDEVWGTGHGSQEALSHAVSEIRHALDDHSDHPEYVQTLPKRGYRLIAEVAPVTAAASTASMHTQGGTAVTQIGLFENLKRRGVLETGLTYLVLGWLLIQIADIVFTRLFLPDWVATFVTVLVIAGFPIAIALSWFLEFRDGRTVLDDLSPGDSRKRRFSRTYLSVLGALSIAAVVVFVYDQSIGLPEAEITRTRASAEEIHLPPVRDNSIAVLRFFNLDGSEQTEAFSNGLADDIITRLSQVPGLLVSSRGDSFTLDANTASAKVRERLRVALYLEGSIQIDGETMRVIMQLIESETGFHKLSRSFDRSLEGFFAMRDEITDIIVANVRIALPPETQVLPVADFDETNLNAYVLYHKGKEVYDQPKTFGTIAEAVGYYEQALELDPQYAAAHAGVCDAYVSRYVLSNSVDDIERAERACAAALASSPNLQMVHVALGTLYWRTGHTAEAEAAFNEALAINPQFADAMTGLANVYQRQQKYTEAEALFRTAIATQPGNWETINNLARFLFSMGRYVESADAYRQVSYLDPTNFHATSGLGSALTMAGDFEAGKQAYEESLALEPSQTVYSNLGVIYYYLGEYDNSVAMNRKAVKLSPRDAVTWLNLADALHFTGDSDESMFAFRRTEELAASRTAIDPTDFDTLFTLAWAQQMTEQSEKAQETVARGLLLAPNDPYGFYYDALIDVQAGEHENALDSLRLALDNGYPANMLAVEPYLEELRGNREFQALIAENH
jgi:tetratricopeptide (TPR) repeat protein/DNA-binding winged helix-turn-helix (wHTH) protein